MQSLVSPTPDDTLPRKVVSGVRETLILLWKLKPGLWRGPDQPRRSPGTHAHTEGRRNSPNFIYRNSRSTAIPRLLLVYIYIYIYIYMIHHIYTYIYTYIYIYIICNVAYNIYTTNNTFGSNNMSLCTFGILGARVFTNI